MFSVKYYKGKTPNFGDDLNSWIWTYKFPEFNNLSRKLKILGIGSILSHEFLTDDIDLVISSGIGYGIPPKNITLENILAVRGKLSTKILNIPEEYAIADGAALLHNLHEFQVTPKEDRTGTIFIPHHRSLNENWLEICQSANIDFISPTLDSQYIIHKIRNSKLVLAESMHAAIIADAMRVPWIPIVSNEKISSFKWSDWLSVYDMSYTPIYIGHPSLKITFESFLKIRRNMSYFKENASQLDAYSLLSKNTGKLPLFERITLKLFSKLVLRIPFIGSFISKKQKNKISKLLLKIKEQPGYITDDHLFLKQKTTLEKKIRLLISQTH